MGQLAAAPRRAEVEELGASQDEQDGGRVPEARGEVVEQVQLALVGPVHVLEHEHRRLLQGETFRESLCGEEQDVAVAGRGIDTQAEHQGKVSGHFRHLVGR